MKYALDTNIITYYLNLKLKEAEYQAASVKKRYSHDEVMSELRAIVSGKKPLRKRRRGLTDV
jgi:predicted nucleic acid-binding protein